MLEEQDIASPPCRTALAPCRAQLGVSDSHEAWNIIKSLSVIQWSSWWYTASPSTHIFFSKLPLPYGLHHIGLLWQHSVASWAAMSTIGDHDPALTSTFWTELSNLVGVKPMANQRLQITHSACTCIVLLVIVLRVGFNGFLGQNKGVFGLPFWLWFLLPKSQKSNQRAGSRKQFFSKSSVQN